MTDPKTSAGELPEPPFYASSSEVPPEGGIVQYPWGEVLFDSVATYDSSPSPAPADSSDPEPQPAPEPPTT